MRNMAAPMKTLAEILKTIQADQRDVDNWISRLKLASAFPEPGRGKARLFSKTNTLELAIIAALVRGGAKPSQAAVFANSFLRHVSSDGKPVRKWLVFPAGNLDRAIGLNGAPDLLRLHDELGALTLTFVHVSEIVRRVNELYAGEG